jgi:hypothetical protein
VLQCRLCGLSTAVRKGMDRVAISIAQGRVAETYRKLARQVEEARSRPDLYAAYFSAKPSGP